MAAAWENVDLGIGPTRVHFVMLHGKGEGGGLRGLKEWH